MRNRGAADPALPAWREQREQAQSQSSLASLVVSIGVQLIAEQRGDCRLLGNQIMRLATVVHQVVQLFLAVLRRGDELVQPASVAIDHRKSVRQEVRLV